MNLQRAEKIAKALLYEGYILYPYRPSSVKNQRRFNFGVIVPQTYSEAQGDFEKSYMQTECLVHAKNISEFVVKVHFLQLQSQEVWAATDDQSIGQSMPSASSIRESGQVYQKWQEAIEREIVKTIKLEDLKGLVKQLKFSFPEHEEREQLRNEDGKIVCEIVRRQEAVKGTVKVKASRCGDNLYKLNIRIINLTQIENAEHMSRDEALNFSFVSAHTLIGVRYGEFVSLLDPPEEYRSVAESCSNIGTWPVLAGEVGDRNLMLSSPIILYDYPQTAPESEGDLFDGTEIDEILLLRILTLTDEEKREMRSADERSRKILERAEALSSEQLMKLHGVLRNIRQLEE